MHSPNGRPAIFNIVSVMLCTGSVGSTAAAGMTLGTAAAAALAALPDGDADPGRVHRAVLCAAASVAAAAVDVVVVVVVVVGLAVSRCVASPAWLLLLDVLLVGVAVVAVLLALAELPMWLLVLAAVGAMAGAEPAVPKSPTGRTRYCCRSTTWFEWGDKANIAVI